MSFMPAPSLPYEGIGIVEDGDTASRAIDKDQIVIWKGANYYAKTDILQGASFVVDTNLTAIPDGVLNRLVESVDALSDHLAKQFVLIDSKSTSSQEQTITIPSDTEVLAMFFISSGGTIIAYNQIAVDLLRLNNFQINRYDGNGMHVANVSLVNNTFTLMDSSTFSGNTFYLYGK